MIVAACSNNRGRGAGTPDSGNNSDSGAGDDAGNDGGMASDMGSGTDGDTTTDSGTPTLPTPQFDEEGCLTLASANELCSFDGAVVCAAAVECAGADGSQCGIDCTMATALCLSETQVYDCLDAVSAGCGGTWTACDGWLYFSE